MQVGTHCNDPPLKKKQDVEESGRKVPVAKKDKGKRSRFSTVTGLLPSHTMTGTFSPRRGGTLLPIPIPASASSPKWCKSPSMSATHWGGGGKQPPSPHPSLQEVQPRDNGGRYAKPRPHAFLPSA